MKKSAAGVLDAGKLERFIRRMILAVDRPAPLGLGVYAL
jgi:hypothetical protein